MTKGWLTALPVLFSGVVHGDDAPKASEFDLKLNKEVIEAVTAAMPAAKPIPLYNPDHPPRFRMADFSLKTSFGDRMLRAAQELVTDRIGANDQYDGITLDLWKFHPKWTLQFMGATDGNGDIDKSLPPMPTIRVNNAKKIDDDDPAAFLWVQYNF